MSKGISSLASVVTTIVVCVSSLDSISVIKPVIASSATPSALLCDTPQAYYGIQHCVDSTGQAHVVTVDLSDRHVKVETVLSANRQSLEECNSVNGGYKDTKTPSNCPYPYPLETLESMLNRYKSSGAVAIINTDYFGCGTQQFPCDQEEADHGAQGLAVKNGLQLSGPDHGADANAAAIAYKQPSLAISQYNIATIGIPGSQVIIDNNEKTTYFNTVAGAPILIDGGAVVNTDCHRIYLDMNYPGDTCSRPAQSAAGLISNRRLVLATTTTNGPSGAVAMANFLRDNFHVQQALKFDGGGSAHIAWLDGEEKFHDYDPTGSNRWVAEALVIFSSPIRNSTGIADIPSPDAYSCRQSGNIDFEAFPDNTNLSSGTIAGVHFTTTGGYTWRVGDFATGTYNGKYPNGAYTSHSTHWAWLGENQGAGRIDFPEGPAAFFSLLVGDYSPVYLDAYGTSGSLLATAGPAPNNIDTGHMTELRITRATPDMAYVIVHDTGNYFLIDDVCTDAPGTPNTINTVVDQNYFMQTGQHVFGSFITNIVTGAHKFLHFVLGPFYSDVDLKLTRPDGSVVATSDEGVTYIKTANSVEISIDNAPVGQWSYEIIANQLELGGENIRVVGEDQTIISVYSSIYLPVVRR